LACTASGFLSALLGILWGFIADKFGKRWLGIVGSLVMTVALFLLSSQSCLAGFYVFYFLLSAVGHAMVSSSLVANVGC
jgi:MFS family permease